MAKRTLLDRSFMSIMIFYELVVFSMVIHFGRTVAGSPCRSIPHERLIPLVASMPRHSNDSVSHNTR